MTHTPSIEDPYFNYNSRGEVSQSKRFAGTVANPGAENTAEDFDYGFDPIGNRKTSNVGNSANPRAYSVNTLNQYTAITQPAENPQHDLDGDQTSDGTWTYEWDAENRLIYAGKPDGLGYVHLYFQYDYMGRRVYKMVETWDGVPGHDATATEQFFVYDGWNLMAILDPQSSILQSFIWGLDLSGTLQGAGGVGGLLAVWDCSTLNWQPSTHYYCYDGNGNVVALVRADGENAGSLSAHYEYGPFGELLTTPSGMGLANPFCFSTKYQDNETGLLYYGYRYLDTVTGRWRSRDPIQEQARQENIYSFLRNDPVALTDFLGHCINCAAASAIPSSPPPAPHTCPAGKIDFNTLSPKKVSTKAELLTEAYNFSRSQATSPAVSGLKYIKQEIKCTQCEGCKSVRILVNIKVECHVVYLDDMNVTTFRYHRNVAAAIKHEECHCEDWKAGIETVAKRMGSGSYKNLRECLAAKRAMNFRDLVDAEVLGSPPDSHRDPKYGLKPNANTQAPCYATWTGTL